MRVINIVCSFEKVGAEDVIFVMKREIVNDVVVVLIGIFGKSFKYRGDSAQNFIFVILFTSLLNFKWA